jgi:hypothetical protein
LWLSLAVLIEISGRRESALTSGTVSSLSPTLAPTLLAKGTYSNEAVKTALSQ